MGDISRNQLRVPLNGIAAALDEHLHELYGRRIGFCLQVFELTAQDAPPSEVNVAYISNAQREGCIDVLRHLLAMFEVGMESAPPGPQGKA
jgi:hypothetical protein